MKSQSEIQRRLKKLRFRYAKKHIDSTQKRTHVNCTYNYSQKPFNQTRNTVEIELAPRQVSTVVFIQEEKDAYYCMYGAQNPKTWPGIICDRNQIAETCKWFFPKISAEEAEDQFNKLMEDDEYVYDKYADIAALQWVVNDRIYKYKISWFYKIILFISSFMHKLIDKMRKRRMKAEPSVCQLPESDLPKELWTDDSIKDSRT